VLRLKPIRLLALGGLVLLGFLYWKPLHTYLQTKHELQTRNAEVRALRTSRQARAPHRPGRLERPADARSTQARLVKPGEQLFIVKGITAWRHRK